jgi:hypothetical protein
MLNKSGYGIGTGAGPEPEPKSEPKLFQSRDRNRNKSLRFHNTVFLSDKSLTPFRLFQDKTLHTVKCSEAQIFIRPYVRLTF